MSDASKKPVGSINWVDLTVPNAQKIRDFYQRVIGWSAQGLSMGDYDDYCMNLPGNGETVAGICHARGVNADFPPVWLIYINVADLDESIANCRKLGGQLISGPRDMGPQGRYCVIKDPAGAPVALFEPAE